MSHADSPETLSVPRSDPAPGLSPESGEHAALSAGKMVAAQTPSGQHGSRRTWGNTAGGAAIMVVVAAGFFLAAGRPLWHTDLWGHLAYGRLIWESGAIPETAPLMPLARGVEFIDSAWLAQVLGFLAIREFGATAMQAAAGLCVALAGGVLMAIGWRKTGSLAWTLVGGAVWLWLEWKQLIAGGDWALLIRPQIIGMLAFSLTLAILVARPRWWHWLAVPTLFAAWANLHGSCAVGLVLVGLFAAGRAADRLRRTDRFGAICLDWIFWRYFLLGELAAAAVLLNPYGLRLYLEIWSFSSNPNLPSLIEWQPLSLRMFQGQAAAAIAVVLVFLLRMTPRRIQTTEILALLVFGGIALWTSRFIVWWGPIAAWCVMRHAAAIWRPSPRGADQSVTSRPAWARRPNPLWSLVGIAALVLAFVMTPFGGAHLRGRQIPFEQQVSAGTPLGAARHLGELTSGGIVFNAMEYGDFLMWTHPGIDVFAGSHVHLIPAEVWDAYRSVVNGQSGWRRVLDRYGVETIVLDRSRRQTFIDTIADDDNWQLSYQDNISSVFRRAESAGAATEEIR